MLITIGSPHPSSGKTTLAVNLAAGLKENGHQVLLVTNRQDQFWLDWWNHFQGFFPVDMLCLEPESNLQVYTTNYDYIITDTNNLSALTSSSPLLPACQLLCLDFSFIDATFFSDALDRPQLNTYVVPCKVKHKEWATIELLDILASQVGPDSVTEPIPY